MIISLIIYKYIYSYNMEEITEGNIRPILNQSEYLLFFVENFLGKLSVLES